MTAHGGFRWPKRGKVEAPDWDPRKECGNGLHGALWGEGDGRLLSWADDAKWQVVRVDSEIVDLGGKVKFKKGYVVFTGTREEATKRIIKLGAAGAVIGGLITAGDSGTATAGVRGTATAGVCGTATAGYSGTATAGDSGTATAGHSGTATAGDYGTATAGVRGTIMIKYWDVQKQRYYVKVGNIGEDDLKPNVKYQLNSKNEFEATNE
jgi:hypothetical protein